MSSRLAARDLACRIETPFAAEYERLRVDFNAAVGQLQDAVKLIVSNAGAIRSGTQEISRAADDLSQRTERQAASLKGDSRPR